MGVAALIAMSLGLVVLVVGQGFSSIGAVKAVEDVALGVIVVAALMGAVALVAVRMADWREPESEAEFEALVNRSEKLAREGLAVDPDENEFLELDPLNDDDFEELVRDALDDLPDLLRNALEHVAVVISDGGRRRGAYGLYQGGQTRRDDTHDRIVIFRDTLRRDFGHDAELLRDQVVRTVRHELAHHVGFDELGVATRSIGDPRRIRSQGRGAAARPGPNNQGEEQQMPEAVIVDAIRTPIGRAVKGSLKTVRADDLAAIPLKALIERNPQLDQSTIGDVMMGCGYGEGEAGYNIGRLASLLAGIDYHVPGCTVNRFCASSLQTTRMAFHAIKTGEGDTYIAAGVEAVSRAGQGAPFEFHPLARRLGGLALQRVHLDGHDRRERRRRAQSQPRVPGRVGARLPDARGRRAGIGALRQGDRPRHRARAQRRRSSEGNEIDVPETVVTKDDGPRAGTTLEKLASLKPVFKEGGSVTAGNACPLNDGAAALLVMSDEKAPSRGLQAARADRRLDGRRDPSRGDGPRPDPGDRGAAEEHGHVDVRHRRRRDQRGVRRADRPLQRDARHPRREAQPLRRRDRAWVTRSG